MPVAVDGRDDGRLVAGDPTNCSAVSAPRPLPAPARRAFDMEVKIASCSSTSRGGFSIERGLRCCCRLLFMRRGSVTGSGAGEWSWSRSNTGVEGDVGAVACTENESRMVCADADEDAADVFRAWRRKVSSESQSASSGYGYVAVRGYPRSS